MQSRSPAGLRLPLPHGYLVPACIIRLGGLCGVFGVRKISVLERLVSGPRSVKCGAGENTNLVSAEVPCRSHHRKGVPVVLHGKNACGFIRRGVLDGEHDW